MGDVIRHCIDGAWSEVTEFATSTLVNPAHGAYPDLTAPFGGYKQSGNGRVWGLGSLEEYLETKAVVATA